MPFPPSDMVAAFSRHLHFKSLEQAMRERHPDMADRVRFDDTDRLMHLKVYLSERNAVGLAQVRMEHTVVWAVLDPVLNSDPSVWSLNTPDEVLVDALHALASARLIGEPVASPWRWNESEPSDMTKLADLLDARGLRVRRVAAGNRYVAYGPRQERKLDIVRGREGSFVEVGFPEAFVRVSLKPTLGWLVDAHFPDWGAWGRVDLGWHLWHETLPAPGVPYAQTSVAEICDLLGKGPRAWAPEAPWDAQAPWEPSGHRAPVSDRPRSGWQESLFADLLPFPSALEDGDGGFSGLSEKPVPAGPRGSLGTGKITDAVLQQLTTFGFGDLEEGDAESPIRSDVFHVEWRAGAKDLSTPEVQRLNGLAAAAGEDVPKRLIAITESGISRPAAAFADKAKAFVFHIDRATGRLMALNSRAEEALLPHTDPGELTPDP
ncbi:hypothetical protein [Streptomyces sp. JNUCC 63]